jgi:anhydro-N-acetylmuramic acid kinase
MKLTIVLGIMSGTSLDGVDYALCAIEKRRVELLKLWSANFPAPLQRRLHAAARNEASSYEVAQLHHDLGRFYTQHALRKNFRSGTQLIGLHGQTIFHNPNRKAPATFQLGEPAYLAEALRVPVVSNFRVADLAAGGQGAPLATLFHLRVFARRGRHVCVNNLGGISNVTSIDWRRGVKPVVVAFDTGPANMLIDLAMRELTGGRQSCDRDGAWAARGQICEPLLQRWLAHPFFKLPPPKSTGRELFGESFFTKVRSHARRAGLTNFDLLATLTSFTARSLAENYRRHLPSQPDKVILAGGGAANRTLVRWIDEELQKLSPSVDVCTSDHLGWPLQSIEPAAFALLAWLRWRGQAGTLPATTGAKRAVLSGQVTATEEVDRAAV